MNVAEKGQREPVGIQRHFKAERVKSFRARVTGMSRASSVIQAPLFGSGRSTHVNK